PPSPRPAIAEIRIRSITPTPPRSASREASTSTFRGAHLPPFRAARKPFRGPPCQSARVQVRNLEQLVARGWIAAEGTTLRDEDRKKARELAGLLTEIERATARISRARRELVLVD